MRQVGFTLLIERAPRASVCRQQYGVVREEQAGGGIEPTTGSEGWGWGVGKERNRADPHHTVAAYANQGNRAGDKREIERKRCAILYSTLLSASSPLWCDLVCRTMGDVSGHRSEVLLPAVWRVR